MSGAARERSGAALARSETSAVRSAAAQAAPAQEVLGGPADAADSEGAAWIARVPQCACSAKDETPAMFPGCCARQTRRGTGLFSGRLLAVGSGRLLFAAGSGRLLLAAGSGRLLLAAGSGRLLLAAGSGRLLFTGGSERALLGAPPGRGSTGWSASCGLRVPRSFRPHHGRLPLLKRGLRWCGIAGAHDRPIHDRLWRPHARWRSRSEHAGPRRLESRGCA